MSYVCAPPSLHGCVDVVDVEEHLDGGRRRRVARVQDAEPVGLKEVRLRSSVNQSVQVQD